MQMIKWIKKVFHIHIWKNYYEGYIIYPMKICEKCNLVKVYAGPAYGWKSRGHKTCK